MSTTTSSWMRSALWLLLSTVTILIGVLAIVAPMAAGLGATIAIGWLIALAGGSHVALAFEPQRWSSRVWHVLAGLIYLVGGVLVVMSPHAGLLSLTLFLAAMFLASGLCRLATAFALRAKEGVGWLFADGILTVLLGGLIYMDWPWNSHWLVGTLVGITFVFNGVAGLAFSFAPRRRAAEREPTGHLPLPDVR